MTRSRSKSRRSRSKSRRSRSKSRSDKKNRIIKRSGGRYFHIHGLTGSGCRRYKKSFFYEISPSGTPKKVSKTDARQIGTKNFNKIPASGILKLTKNGKTYHYQIMANKLRKINID